MLIVGYTDDDNYIYMDPARGRLYERGISTFNEGNEGINNLAISIKYKKNINFNNVYRVYFSVDK